MNTSETDFLFVHVPKASNYYRVLDEFTFINYLPMGVFALCDLLNRSGVPSRIKHVGLETILDPEFSIAQFVKEQHIRVIGMSLHWHYQSFDVLDVAKKIKQASPQTTIVLGGLTASRFAEEILREFREVDAVICGDGEGSVVPFAKCALQHDSFESVANCVWRDAAGQIVNNGITFVADQELLSELDFANLSLLDRAAEYRDYFKMPMFWMNNASTAMNLRLKMASDTMFPLFLGRGCPGDCTFCGGGKAAQQRICGRSHHVFRSPESVIETIESAMEQGYSSFLTCFDPSPADDSFWLDVLGGLRRKNLKCGLAVECWGLPSDRMLREFRETVDIKRSYIALSPESGSEAVRRRNKRYFFYSNEQLFGAMERLLEHRIPTMVYFTAGIPDETSENIRDTIALAKTLRKRFRKVLDRVFCIPVQIEPGSPLFEDPDAHGVRSTRATFRDFYESHQRCDSGPFDYLGYATDALAEVQGDVDQFTAYLQSVRCQDFCVVTPRVLGKVDLKFASRAMCNLRVAAWKWQGHGSLPETRRTYR